MSEQPLRGFLSEKAGVSPKFLERVLAICDEEMIGDVSQLEVARDAGLLPTFFKPVIALGIEAALKSAPDVTEAVTAVKALLGPTVAVPAEQFEATPYHDMSKIPLNTYKAKVPLLGSVASVKRIVGANAPGMPHQDQLGSHIQVLGGPVARRHPSWHQSQERETQFRPTVLDRLHALRRPARRQHGITVRAARRVLGQGSGCGGSGKEGRVLQLPLRFQTGK